MKVQLSDEFVTTSGFSQVYHGDGFWLVVREDKGEVASGLPFFGMKVEDVGTDKLDESAVGR